MQETRGNRERYMAKYGAEHARGEMDERRVARERYIMAKYGDDWARGDQSVQGDKWEVGNKREDIVKERHGLDK